MNAVAEELEIQAGPVVRFRAAVAEDLRSLTLLHDHELEREVIMDLWRNCYEGFLGLRLETVKGREAVALLRKGLTDIPVFLSSKTMDTLAAEYADIYLNHSFGASPCESVWLDDDHLSMQEPMFQVRAWYQRYGLVVADWRKRTDDHLVNQMLFLAHLLDPEAVQGSLSETARFMDEHILRWIGDFAERIAGRCKTRFYAGLAMLTAVYLSELRGLLAELAGEPVPSPEEIAERMRPKVTVAVESPGRYVPGVAPSW